MACLRITQYKDEQTRRDVLQPLLDGKSAGRCKRRGGFLLAMLFLLTLQLKWKDKAPMLTIQDVREILEVILPRRRITKKEILEIVKRKHKARESARKSHHKRKSKPN